MFNDLREFIQKADEFGECKFIDGANWDLEVGHITELSQESPIVPLLVFDKIKGYPAGYRIATNVLSSDKRISLALGLPYGLTGMDIVRAWRDKVQQGYQAVPPVQVRKGAVKENILLGDKIDLYKFPVPKWHSLDGGRYIGTGDMVIQKDPDTGWVNLGTYRIQIHDKKTATYHAVGTRHGNYITKKYWEKGLACPTVVVCGGDPLLWNAAAGPVPYQVSEYDYAGWLRNKPFEVVKGETVDLPIPATAEIALEGEVVSPDVETRIEGPFGEWEGYYSGGKRPDPVFRITGILHRNDPIILGAPPLPGPFSAGSAMQVRLSAELWDEMDKNVPGVQGVWFVPAARLWQMVVISLKQAYPGHAKQAALFASGSYKGQASIGRMIVVVDDDIDPSNVSDVLWAMGTRWDPATATDIIGGCPSMRSDPGVTPDQRERRDYQSSRALIYACKPYSWMNEYPASIKSSAEEMKKVNKKWGKLLFGK